MQRTVTLVLVDRRGAVLGALPPYPVPVPWWQEVAEVVAGARRRYGVEVTVLRLLTAQRPEPHGGAVTYLAETADPPAVALNPASPDLAPHPLRALWAQPAGPSASLAWAARYLDGPDPVAVQQRTWNLSAIWRLTSASGVAWLKQVPGFFGHEPAVLRWVASVAPRRVPAVLADDPGTGRMLLADAPGVDRYDAPPGELAGLIDDLHAIQRHATGQVDRLRAAGVPDDGHWATLGGRVRATVAGYAPVLAPAERAALLSLVDGLGERFAAIDRCGLPDTLVHGDFHAGNARGDGRVRTIIDWGDSFLGHPGFDALRIADGQPPDTAAALHRHWAGRWRAAVPGCDPERALALLAPVAALRAAAVYAAFLAAIEPSERPYHAADVPRRLRAAIAA